MFARRKRISNLRGIEDGPPNLALLLAASARGMAWRENNRRVGNGEQYLVAASAALAYPVSRQWKGYWQRSA